MSKRFVFRVAGLLAGLALLLGVAAVPAAAQGDAGGGEEPSAAQRCFEHHRFGAEPVDVAKSVDGETVLAQVGWGWHEAIGCYLALDDEAVAVLRAAPAPQSLPEAPTDASRRCFEHHQFGERPVDVVKSADRQSVLARLSWGYHDSIGCYLTLDDTALATLRAAHTAGSPPPTPTRSALDGFHVWLDGGVTYLCGPNPDNTIACWMDGTQIGANDVPLADFDMHADFGVQNDHPRSITLCGLTLEKVPDCWAWWGVREQTGRGGSSNWNWSLIELDAPAGPFAGIALHEGLEANASEFPIAWSLWCGYRADQTVACWDAGTMPDYLGRGESYLVQLLAELDAPAGSFVDIYSQWSTAASSFSEIAWCGLRADQTVACWRWDYDRFGHEGNRTRDTVELDSPAGSFVEVFAAGHGWCGFRADKSIDCWILNYERDDGDNQWVLTEFDPPTGAFVDVFAAVRGWCGLRADGTFDCWRWNFWSSALEGIEVPAGSFADAFASGGDDFLCGLRPDLSIVCWHWVWQYDQDGNQIRVPVELDSPAGSFADVSAAGDGLCGLRPDQSIVCWVWDWQDDHEGNARRVLVELEVPVQT